MAKVTLVDLYTPEGETLAGQPWQTYPRPQLRRDSFFNLNGSWDFAVTQGAAPEVYDQKILVPFPPESLLSGIHQVFPHGSLLYYRRTFRLPEGFLKDRVLLHFGAADQVAQVWLNGTLLGEHIGGYEAFSFDITQALEENNILVVCVKDNLKDHILPYGKQRYDRGGMWYTPVSGLWQTVWLESVPQTYVQSLHVETTATTATITAQGITQGTLTVETPDGPLTESLAEGICKICLPSPRLWSPEDPYLYRFVLEAGEDRVESYFALRTLTTEKIDGIPRLCLNGKPYFFHGVLDQGYWSDGLFTPAAPECFARDILAMKALGFNTLRKHIKIEPEQFYYDCDRLGMVVFQDMVNNGDYSFFRDTALPTIGLKKRNDKKLHQDKQTRAAFTDGMEATVRQLYNHPCVCYWTIFNEGWGQFDSQSQFEKLLELDDSRWIDTTSGWFRCGQTDVESIHVYFKPVKLPKTTLPLFLSEFGGYSYKPEGHVFNIHKTYGYRFFKEQAAFTAALLKLYEEEILPARQAGLCAAVYTQLSDVEDETNGLLSYDRKICKVDEQAMYTLAQRLKY